MTTADQVLSLITSHFSRDDDRFRRTAAQIAADSKGRLGNEIKNAVEKARGFEPVQLSGDISNLLRGSMPTTTLTDMVLDPEVRVVLERVLVENRDPARINLIAHGLRPAHRLLLLGPPGTGKTMTASALAGELNWPMFSVKLHGLIANFLGETGKGLGKVFDYIRQNRAVYLFDEFDALGADRGRDHDVQEMRRVLNSFLMFVEDDDIEGIIVAATNHPQMLDFALHRRFDHVINYELPDEQAKIVLMQKTLERFDCKFVSWPDAVHACDGISHAEIVSACRFAAKTSLIEDCELSSELLIGALEERRRYRQVDGVEVGVSDESSRWKHADKATDATNDALRGLLYKLDARSPKCTKCGQPIGERHAMSCPWSFRCSVEEEQTR